jgi:hypothetical protein
MYVFIYVSKRVSWNMAEIKKKCQPGNIGVPIVSRVLSSACRFCKPCEDHECHIQNIGHKRAETKWMVITHSVHSQTFVYKLFFSLSLRLV